MIYNNQNDQYYFGTKYNKKTDLQGEVFRYAIVDYERNLTGQIAQNLIASQKTITIKTNYNLQWQTDQYVVLQNGKKYIILQVATMEQEVNPQTMFFFKSNVETDYVLQLLEIDNTENLQ